MTIRCFRPLAVTPSTLVTGTTPSPDLTRSSRAYIALTCYSSREPSGFCKSPDFVSPRILGSPWWNLKKSLHASLRSCGPKTSSSLALVLFNLWRACRYADIPPYSPFLLKSRFAPSVGCWNVLFFAKILFARGSWKSVLDHLNAAFRTSGSV